MKEVSSNGNITKFLVYIYTTDGRMDFGSCRLISLPNIKQVLPRNVNLYAFISSSLVVRQYQCVFIKVCFF